MIAGDLGRRVALAKWQVLTFAAVGGLGLGGAGVVAWKSAKAASATAPAPKLTADEMRLWAKAEDARAKQMSEARKLKQADIGGGYQVDVDGTLTGPGGTDLPTNKSLDEVGSGASGGKNVAAEIAQGIRGRSDREGDEPDGYGLSARDSRGDDREEKAQRADLERPMLGYSTVRGAKWAARRPDVGDDDGSSTKKPAGTREGSIGRAINSTEQRLAALKDMVPPTGGGSVAGSGPSGGPAKSGNDLMPAEEQAQPMAMGTVGDMRVGGNVGPDQIVRQGKFLDCVMVNEVRADLMESPVIGMVSRDFVSLDGEYVLVPAGAKLIGSAGRVQNLQQARVYIRFDRILFPDQRSAYFPVRKFAAVDGTGAVGIEGDVDRHFFLTFGSAVMLGMLDGLAAAVEGANSAATPTARDLIMARTSMNMSQVVAGIISRYGNVVPTITVEAGSKMKVFFAEDVKLSPYMRAADLSWVKVRGR